MLGRSPIAKYNSSDIQGLGEVSRELPVAIGRADGETATMSMDNYAGAIGTNGERPDSLNIAEAITLATDVLWLQRRLAPFIEHTTQVRSRQIRMGNHAVGPVLIERAQRPSRLAYRLAERRPSGGLIVGWISQRGQQEQQRRAPRPGSAIRPPYAW